MKGKLAETLRELAETIKVFPAHAGVILNLMSGGW